MIKEFIKEHKLDIIRDCVFIIIILGLLVSNFKLRNRSNSVSTGAIPSNVYVNDSTFQQTYQSKTLSSLKKENQALYEKVNKMENAKDAVTFKYKYRYSTDTILVGANTPNEKDSTYNFCSNANDTVSYNLSVNGAGIKWYKIKFLISSTFTVIHSQNGDNNAIDIINKNGEVSNVTSYSKKQNKNFFSRFAIGPQIGVGLSYLEGGTIKPSIFVGMGLTYNLFK